MSVNGGLVGPKVRSKGVADGQQVNIPALVWNRFTNGVTARGRLSRLKIPVQKVS